jgi:hypothetical protein
MNKKNIGLKKILNECNFLYVESLSANFTIKNIQYNSKNKNLINLNYSNTEKK